MTYRCRSPLNLYDSPVLERLATQMSIDRQLRIISVLSSAVQVCLCEDDYSGWLTPIDAKQLELASEPYQAIAHSAPEIQAKIPVIVAFMQAALAQPNHYLWGGTLPPNYDCSGLMQAAFASVGIWIPRDAYQQEAFTQPIALADLIPGDLIFFGTPAKATHVGLYLGVDRYIHSSGREQGRNGIGVDRVSGEGDRVSQTYRAQLRGAGRVVKSYQPQRG